ncbi:NRAMP family divalent metal transporter [Helicobacter baculiformis]|uniref:NRAMP family divalent metal transporter n=1 Tax=Helicobacter baculiformis TaxID=427351 RepID=A0ABV7ZHM6_9HELI|nr:NRAMP family divalent metal transporter [Helicobacter baculiformis]
MAFFSATSTIGPGFLTQSAQFTQELRSSFACVIAISVIASLIAQLNVWRVLSVSQQRGQDIANALLPGLGHFLTFLITLGALAFNIGNVGGAALGLQSLVGLDLKSAGFLSALLAIFIFISKSAGRWMDRLAQVLGILMIVLIAFVALFTHPPITKVLQQTFLPSHFSMPATITLIGGSVGGYIVFAGAHRLIDLGIVGEKECKQVDRGAYLSMSVATLVRVLLFLAVLGVVEAGHPLEANNPAGSGFGVALGTLGYKIFGLVFLAASLTSIVGASYTSVSFLKSFSWVQNHQRACAITLISLSTLIFVFIGKPVALLILAGALNGLVLPISLAVVLVAGYRRDLVGTYRHSWVLAGLGWVVVGLSAYLGVLSFKPLISMFV